MSLDGLNKKKVVLPQYSKKAYHPIINHNRIVDKKNAIIPHGTQESEFISERVKKLIKREITVDTFNKQFKEKEIDLIADPIQRKLKLISQGKEISYNAMMEVILRHRYQENKVIGYEKKMDNYKALQAHKTSNSHMDLSHTNKKLITKPTVTNSSNNELYDWEANDYRNALEYERKRKEIVKTRPTSQVFNGKINNTPSRSISRKNPNESFDGGQIINWKSPQKSVRQVQVDLNANTTIRNDLNLRSGSKTPVITLNLKKTKSIFKYKNQSNIDLSTMASTTISKKTNIDFYSPRGGGNEKERKEVDLFRPKSTKNLKLHMSSTDNFLASLKTKK